MEKVEKRIKYVDDYVGELMEEFPIQEKSMLRIVRFLARVITMFMRSGAREFACISYNPLVKGKRKREAFYITRIFNIGHRRSVLAQAIKVRENGES